MKSVSSHEVAVRLPAQSLVGGSGGRAGQLLSEAALIAPISGLCSFSLSRWDKAARNESLQATHGIFTKKHACVLQRPDASCPCFLSAVVFLIAILESLTWFVSSHWVRWVHLSWTYIYAYCYRKIPLCVQNVPLAWWLTVEIRHSGCGARGFLVFHQQISSVRAGTLCTVTNTTRNTQKDPWAIMAYREQEMEGQSEFEIERDNRRLKKAFKETVHLKIVFLSLFVTLMWFQIWMLMFFCMYVPNH